MSSSNKIHKITGWIVFAITATVYFFSAERTGSLWDCGEFILGAYKLEVVHPPGAALFLLIGRMFTWVATLVSDNPEDIAFSVNLMSGIATAAGAALLSQVTIMFSKLMLVGREGKLDEGQNIAVSGAGLVAGLSMAFATSIWFSAVEGEVYAMSTFFTVLTLWAMTRWYVAPDNAQSDRWLIFAAYAAGLSIGVHLLSLLTFPALALFYYYKKSKNPNFLGTVAAAFGGLIALGLIQKFVIAGLPALWKTMELITVNNMGLPFHSGLIPTFIIVGGIIAAGLYYAHKFNNQSLQSIFVAFALIVVSYTTTGVIVVRANAQPPVNMNAPTDAMRLLPYINREQYGDRPLLFGPQFPAEPSRSGNLVEDRYGRVGDHYEYTDYKIAYKYDKKDKVFFPRMADYSQGRPGLYKRWMGMDPKEKLGGRPNASDNFAFFLNYQVGWMYWRYFMWNFSGRQNGDQGYFPWDKSKGHWITGIQAIDEMKLGNEEFMPDSMKENKSRNVYYALPFLFGLLGMFFQFKRRPNDALALMALFVITGIGIIVYSNQPPNEPRERDYVLAGSIFTYCIWIGMGVVALFSLMTDKLKQSGVIAAGISTVIILVAPILMGTQNFDDHSRREQKASRDYAQNFLQSVEKDAIIFTYGDNDTYPLWYAQEVEHIRTDVRVVNLSLIAVDWYIDLLRQKTNDSPPIKLTISSEAYRGKKRNQIPYFNQEKKDDRLLPATAVLKYIGEDHPLSAGGGRKLESFYPTRKVYMPIDRSAPVWKDALMPTDTNIVKNIPITLPTQMLKDYLAVLDVVVSNINERPVYFAVTCQKNKLLGLQDYMQLEGLALRIVPVKSKSDPNYGVTGSGRVATEKAYNNFMNKFRWGNFDTKELFVSSSYGPSIQTTQLAMVRTAFKLIGEGEKDKSIKLMDQFFTAFPDMNFPYNFETWSNIGVYLAADAYDKAKPHMKILAKRLQQDLLYYTSLDQETLESSFYREYYFSRRAAQDMIDEATRRGDTEYAKELKEMFSGFIEDREATPKLNG